MTHPITPSTELVNQWSEKALTESGIFEVKKKFATLAAQWGADQELHACIQQLYEWRIDGSELNDIRRPESLISKDQALQALGRFQANSHINAGEMMADFDLLSRAIRRLES